MHYKLTVTGGFAGIAQEYQGDLSLPEDEEQELAEVIKESENLPKNKNLRDSFHYDLTLDSTGGKIHAKFDDLDVPPEVARFIAAVRERHRQNRNNRG